MSKIKKKKQTKSDHMVLVLFILLLAVFGLCFGGLVLWHNFKPEEDTTEKEQPAIIKTKEPESKTEEEEEPEPETPQSGTTTEGDEIKEQAAQNERDRQNVSIDENGLKVATVNLTVNYERGVATAHGSVLNIVEEGGTCTYVFKGPNNKEVNSQKSSIADFHGTFCEETTMNKSELGAGIWQVKVKYKSKSAEGESEVQTITVQ